MSQSISIDDLLAQMQAQGPLSQPAGPPTAQPPTTQPDVWQSLQQAATPPPQAPAPSLPPTQPFAALAQHIASSWQPPPRQAPAEDDWANLQLPPPPSPPPQASPPPPLFPHQRQPEVFLHGDRPMPTAEILYKLLREGRIDQSEFAQGRTPRFSDHRMKGWEAP